MFALPEPRATSSAATATATSPANNSIDRVANKDGSWWRLIRVKLRAVEDSNTVAMNSDWIDDEGFRANVGIILTDDHGKLMIAGRVGSKGWQFPQGGMLRGEDAQEAMYRELHEEVGLEPPDVEMLGATSTRDG